MLNFSWKVEFREVEMMDLQIQEKKLLHRLAEYDVKIRARMPEYGLFKLRTVIWRIKRALRKIPEGTYGQCDTCSERIPDERMDIIPAAIMCVLCQRADEERERKVKLS